MKRLPSSRRAWIEIPAAGAGSPRPRVALLAEGVDRNSCRGNSPATRTRVALLAEGVDRNPLGIDAQTVDVVALLAEGVDRNNSTLLKLLRMRTSPSSRRAWIEMSASLSKSQKGTVALLAEGVDRNYNLIDSNIRAASRPPRGGRG